MKTDRYTKIVLTVIAVCLTLLVLGQFGLVNRAYATPSGYGTTTPVSIESGAGTYPGNPLYVSIVE